MKDDEVALPIISCFYHYTGFYMKFLVRINTVLFHTLYNFDNNRLRYIISCIYKQ